MRRFTLVLNFVLSCIVFPQVFASEDLFDLTFDIPTIEFTTEYSSEFGAFAQAQYANEVTYNDIAVFSLGAGESQFLVGLTYAKLCYPLMLFFKKMAVAM